MYSQSKVKQANIASGVTGSLLCEIKCGDIANFKQWRSEWKDIEFALAYDQVFGKDWNLSLETAKDLDTVSLCLTSINLEANYFLIKEELLSREISCAGYTESGRTITIYNNLAQLTIDCSKPTGPQLEAWLVKWY